MTDETAIEPFQAATMANAVYELETKSMQQVVDSKVGVDFTGAGAAPNVASNRINATSGAFNNRPTSGFGYCAQKGNDAFIVTKGTS